MEGFKIKTIIITFILVVILSNSSHALPVSKNQKPIKIIINDWSSQIVLAKITGEIFKTLGYKVEYIQSSSNDQWFRLKSEKLHLQVEVWEGTMAVKANQLLEAKRIIDAGNHDAKTREEWWYPSYVEELCPGLPDWKALNNCAELFATPETAPKGLYLGGPWEKRDTVRIRALSLDFKIIRVKHGDDLWLELEKAMAKKQPIVLFNWTPNWVDARYDGKFIEFPEYTPACETIPEWGKSKKWLWDCGNPTDGWLKKVTSVNFPNDWPCAFSTLKNINFNNEMLSEIAAFVDVNSLSYDEAAKLWINSNQKLWRSWIPVSCEK
ncbi:ABC transporter substrate-binding protein [Psychromonas ossibalaenae]|uniref:ABC transporter substrate-binding protein n=1 Tax=Psychromonas ossibalaenae TaxID=444922 RepID=UPI00035D7888|nr:ABC transporter substrate-binding protein [Psychromonas ossibalaenae]